MKAIDRMGKNKAAAADELLDTIFQVKEWKELENKLRKKKTLRENWRQEIYEKSEEYESSSKDKP